MSVAYTKSGVVVLARYDWLAVSSPGYCLPVTFDSPVSRAKNL